MSSDLNSQIESIAKDFQSLSAKVRGDEAARKKLLGVATQAMTTVETPGETIWKMMFSVS